MAIAHEDRLRAMIEPGQQTWDLSDDDEAAIRWALAGIGLLRRLVAVKADADRKSSGIAAIGRMAVGAFEVADEARSHLGGD